MHENQPRGTFVRAAILSVAALAMALPPLAAQQPTPPADPLLPRLELMLKAMKHARDRHLLKPDTPQLIDGAIRGMLARLDPDAEIYSADELRRFTVSTDLDIGLVVRRIASAPREPSPGYRIVATFDGSPAARAGLRPGDVVTHVDRRPAGEHSMLELTASKLAGSEGRVALRVARQGSPAPIELLLERERRAAPAVTTALLPGGAALIRLASLDASAGAEVARQLGAAKATLGAGFQGLVLDLRNCAGGLVDQAASVADIFLESGTIAKIEARDGKSAQTYLAKPGDLADGRPMAVLVNGGTTGACEAVAAALQEGNRATLVGGATPGLGAIQTAVPLGADGRRGALLLTTQRYLTPSGRRLDKGGVKPDVPLDARPQAADCRDTDAPDATGAGLCERRGASTDEALQAGLALVIGTPPTAARP